MIDQLRRPVTSPSDDASPTSSPCPSAGDSINWSMDATSKPARQIDTNGSHYNDDQRRRRWRRRRRRRSRRWGGRQKFFSVAWKGKLPAPAIHSVTFFFRAPTYRNLPSSSVVLFSFGVGSLAFLTRNRRSAVNGGLRWAPTVFSFSDRGHWGRRFPRWPPFCRRFTLGHPLVRTAATDFCAAACSRVRLPASRLSPPITAGAQVFERSRSPRSAVGSLVRIPVEDRRPNRKHNINRAFFSAPQERVARSQEGDFVFWGGAVPGRLKLSRGGAPQTLSTTKQFHQESKH